MELTSKIIRTISLNLYTKLTSTLIKGNSTFSPVTGGDRFYDNMTSMFGFRINPWIKWCWKYCAPLFCMVRCQTYNTQYHLDLAKDNDVSWFPLHMYNKDQQIILPFHIFITVNRFSLVMAHVARQQLLTLPTSHSNIIPVK